MARDESRSLGLSFAAKALRAKWALCGCRPPVAGGSRSSGPRQRSAAGLRFRWMRIKMKHRGHRWRPGDSLPSPALRQGGRIQGPISQIRGRRAVSGADDIAGLTAGRREAREICLDRTMLPFRTVVHRFLGGLARSRMLSCRTDKDIVRGSSYSYVAKLLTSRKVWNSCTLSNRRGRAGKNMGAHENSGVLLSEAARSSIQWA